MIFKQNEVIKYMALSVLFSVIFVCAVPRNATKLTATYTEEDRVEAVAAVINVVLKVGLFHQMKSSAYPNT
jgi:hypothetical protein